MTDTKPPRVVDTPEKADRYARNLVRSTRHMERIVSDPVLREAWSDLPAEARDEIDYRLSELQAALRAFLSGRGAVAGAGHIGDAPLLASEPIHNPKAGR